MTVYLDNIISVPTRVARTDVNSSAGGRSAVINYPAGVVSYVRGNWIAPDGVFANDTVWAKGYEHLESMLPHAIAMRHDFTAIRSQQAPAGWAAWLLSARVEMPDAFVAPLYPFLFHLYAYDGPPHTEATKTDNPIYRFRWNNEAWSQIYSLPCGNLDAPDTHPGYSRTHLGGIFVLDNRAGATLEVEVGIANLPSNPKIKRAILLMGFT